MLASQFGEWLTRPHKLTTARKRFLVRVLLVIIGFTSLAMLPISAKAQGAAASTVQNPLAVIEFMADLSNYSGQQVFVQGQPYCFSADNCALYDQNGLDKFIYFDPTLTSLNDREHLMRCTVPVSGAGCHGCSGRHCFV